MGSSVASASRGIECTYKPIIIRNWGDAWGRGGGGSGSTSGFGGFAAAAGNPLTLITGGGAGVVASATALAGTRNVSLGTILGIGLDNFGGQVGTDNCNGNSR